MMRAAKFRRNRTTLALSAAEMAEQLSASEGDVRAWEDGSVAISKEIETEVFVLNSYTDSAVTELVDADAEWVSLEDSFMYYPEMPTSWRRAVAERVKLEYPDLVIVNCGEELAHEK